MEDKTIAVRESEKKIAGVGLTDRDWSKETSTHPTRIRITLDEPIGFGRGTNPVEEELDIGIGQDPESDSDEE